MGQEEKGRKEEGKAIHFVGASVSGNSPGTLPQKKRERKKETPLHLSESHGLSWVWWPEKHDWERRRRRRKNRLFSKAVQIRREVEADVELERVLRLVLYGLLGPQRGERFSLSLFFEIKFSSFLLFIFSHACFKRKQLSSL